MAGAGAMKMAAVSGEKQFPVKKRSCFSANFKQNEKTERKGIINRKFPIYCESANAIRFIYMSL